jgi:hypothetical protein
MECAEGRLSLARERGRVRVDFDAASCPNPSPSSSPFLPRGEATKGKRVCWFNIRDQAAELATPHILWPGSPETPSNCVIFRL